MAMCSMAAQAQSTMEWALVEPESGSTVPMSRVGFLLTADDDDTFEVVCNDGTLISGVREVNFKQVDASGIKAVATADGTPAISGGVDGRLRLTGCAEGTVVTVADEGGRTVRRTVADGKALTVDVSALHTGVYILKAGTVCVKFFKK